MEFAMIPAAEEKLILRSFEGEGSDKYSSDNGLTLRIRYKLTLAFVRRKNIL